MDDTDDTASVMAGVENGSVLSDVYLPEEVIIHIFGFIHTDDLLKCALVCKHWCSIVQGHALWAHKLNLKPAPNKRIYEWYTYYYILYKGIVGVNVLKNPNGESLEGWIVGRSGGDGWQLENPPQGSDPVPEEIGATSCFTTSYDFCEKSQYFGSQNNAGLLKVLSDMSPRVYVCDWYAGRFDCGCDYSLIVDLIDADGKVLDTFNFADRIIQWAGSSWLKVEHTFKPCANLAVVRFRHWGKDTQFWRGNYGSKMTGAVVKLLIDY